jgi:BirA family biotin operon repressor/biotin-[acetyl-CoA-carboxylase] ligase
VRESLSLYDPDAVPIIFYRVQQASTWIAGRRVRVHGPQACIGVTEGLDENGFLLVRTATGLVIVQTGGLRAVEDDPQLESASGDIS